MNLPTPPPEPDDPFLAEAVLLKTSGLKPEDARRARNGRYRMGVDWERREKGAVWWRRQAARRFFGELGLPESLLEEKNTPAAADGANSASSADGVVELVVWRGGNDGIANRIIVEAYPPDHPPCCQAEVVRVLVRDNRGFRPMMTIWATHKHDDLYEQAPPPRRKCP